ncbi:MAG: 4-phosphopantetheinyl transferase [Moraxellaceae bacterium]|jgi:4'-phosphopantetheinyl transferase|nr:4-phosphopantetheinyl transferase [Moraxellaceae bacterium]
MTVARIAWLRDDPGQALPPFTARLPVMDREEMARLRLPSRQRSFVLSRLLLRHLLTTYAGIPPEAQCFTRAASGRLLLAGSGPWEISLSHGGGLVAVMVASAPCGVDIERQRATRITRVAERYFAPAEAEWLRTRDNATAERDFFRLWTLKEACVKALGQGLADNMARLAFTLATSPPTLLAPDHGLQVWQAPLAEAWLAAAVRSAGPVDWACTELSLAAL